MPPFQPARNLQPIRVAPGGRYFETFDNEPFHLIGFNDAISWVGLNGLFAGRDYAGAEKYLAHLAENGVTVLRLMLEYTHRESRYFEKPVGRFVPAMVRLWDDIFSLCAAHGIRVLLTPFDTFWMARRWHRHPYNRVNGGPAETPQSLLTDDTTIEAVLNRLRFVVERWGGTGVIAAWDLWNEIHPHWGGIPAEQAAALQRIGDGVRAHEEQCHGFSRPQTISIFGPDPGDYADMIFRGSGLDFATTHVYQGAIDFPEETVQPALLMAKWVRHGCAQTPTSRPFTDSEHGPIHLFNDHRKYLPEPFDDEYERRLMWAHLASGGAGSGLRWPARHPHTATEGMLRALHNLSRFVNESGIDWRHFRSRDANHGVKISPIKNDFLNHFAVADENQTLVYLLRSVPKKHKGIAPQRPRFSDLSVELAVMQPGNYCVRIWDTVGGDLMTRLSLAAYPGNEKFSLTGDFVLTVPLSPFSEEVALTAVHE